MIDNCSSDWNENRFQSLQRTDRRVSFSRNAENLGMGKSIFAGLRLIKNDWALVLSDEDSLMFSDEKFVRHLKALMENSNCDVITLAVSNSEKSWGIKGELLNKKMRPTSVFDLTFYISGLLLNCATMAPTLTRIESAIDSNEMARLYPQTLIAGAAILKGTAWHLGKIAVIQGRPQISQFSLEAVPFNSPSKRMMQLLGFFQFMDSEILEIQVGDSNLRNILLGRMKSAMANRAMWTFSQMLRSLGSDAKASFGSSFLWKANLTIRRLFAQFRMLLFWLGKK